MNQKGFAIIPIIIVIAILLIGGGFYIVIKNQTKLINTVSNSKAEDWKTYTDKQYGFSFQYPLDWQIHNQSFNFSGKKSINILVSSPIHAHLVLSQDALYLLEMGVGSSGQKVIGWSGFFKSPLLSSDGEPISLDIDQNIIKNTKEYQQAQKIFNSLQLLAIPPPSLSTACIDQQDGAPVITSLSSDSGPIGTNLEIRGCNLSGFEGDLDVYFERVDGQKIMLTDNFGSYSKTGGSLIKILVKEPCQQGETVYGRYSGIPEPCKYIAITPGLYKIYAEPFGKRSNEVSFTVK